jgi:hypothetical protein
MKMGGIKWYWWVAIAAAAVVAADLAINWEFYSVPPNAHPSSYPPNVTAPVRPMGAASRHQQPLGVGSSFTYSGA